MIVMYCAAYDTKSLFSLVTTILFDFNHTGKVDTRRLELFSDVESLRYLLKHPLMTSFLEQILSSLKIRYFLEFLLYLGFVIALFMHMGNRYGVFSVRI